jgi:hypothetical protein
MLAGLLTLAIAFVETGAKASQWITRQDARFGFNSPQ